MLLLHGNSSSIQGLSRAQARVTLQYIHNSYPQKVPSEIQIVERSLQWTVAISCHISSILGSLNLPATWQVDDGTPPWLPQAPFQVRELHQPLSKSQMP